jgi:hypothetical protein
MTHIVRIFRKDVRRLWPQLLPLWAMMALTAMFDPFPSGLPSSQDPAWILHQLHIAEAVACWLAMVTLIHQERLAASSYWLARPIGWKELLAAKALFVGALVNLPLLICELAAWRPALIWRQLLFTALVILPSTAIASVTADLGHAALAALAGYLAAVEIPSAFHFYGDWIPGWRPDGSGPENWPVALAISAAALAVVLVRYASRCGRGPVAGSHRMGSIG